jgi:hypothetical protein
MPAAPPTESLMTRLKLIFLKKKKRKRKKRKYIRPLKKNIFTGLTRKLMHKKKAAGRVYQLLFIIE